MVLEGSTVKHWLNLPLPTAIFTNICLVHPEPMWPSLNSCHLLSLRFQRARGHCCISQQDKLLQHSTAWHTIRPLTAVLHGLPTTAYTRMPSYCLKTQWQHMVVVISAFLATSRGVPHSPGHSHRRAQQSAPGTCASRFTVAMQCKHLPFPAASQGHCVPHGPGHPHKRPQLCN